MKNMPAIEMKISEDCMENRRNQRIPPAIALLIVVFACAVAYFGARLFTGMSKRTAFDYRTVNLPSNVALEVVDDGFVYYDGSSIVAESTEPAVKWSYLIGKDASFHADDFGVAAWSDNTVTLIDAGTGTTSYSVSLDAEVLSARGGERYTAVLLGPEHDSTIVLLDKGGKKVNSITLTSQTVIDYGFLSGGTLLWVMTLDTSGTAPSCTINTYRPGKERVGMIHDNEQLVYGVVFQSSFYCCVGNTHLKVYDYTGNKENKDRRRLVYGWYMAALDSALDDPMMAFVPNGQYDSSAGMRDMRMIRASLDQQVRMPYGCQSLIAKGNRVYGFSTEGYVMIAEQGVPSVSAYRLPILFDKVYGVTAGGCAVLANGGTIYLMNLS